MKNVNNSGEVQGSQSQKRKFVIIKYEYLEEFGNSKIGEFLDDLGVFESKKEAEKEKENHIEENYEFQKYGGPVLEVEEFKKEGEYFKGNQYFITEKKAGAWSKNAGSEEGYENIEKAKNKLLSFFVESDDFDEIVGDSDSIRYQISHHEDLLKKYEDLKTKEDDEDDDFEITDEDNQLLEESAQRDINSNLTYEFEEKKYEIIDISKESICHE